MNVFQSICTYDVLDYTVDIERRKAAEVLEEVERL